MSNLATRLLLAAGTVIASPSINQSNPAADVAPNDNNIVRVNAQPSSQSFASGTYRITLGNPAQAQLPPGIGGNPGTPPCNNGGGSGGCGQPGGPTPTPGGGDHNHAIARTGAVTVTQQGGSYHLSYRTTIPAPAYAPPPAHCTLVSLGVGSTGPNVPFSIAIPIPGCHEDERIANAAINAQYPELQITAMGAWARRSDDFRDALAGAIQCDQVNPYASRWDRMGAAAGIITPAECARPQVQPYVLNIVPQPEQQIRRRNRVATPAPTVAPVVTPPPVDTCVTITGQFCRTARGSEFRLSPDTTALIHRFIQTPLHSPAPQR